MVKPVSVSAGAKRDALLVGTVVGELLLVGILIWIPMRFPNPIVQWYHIVIELLGILAGIAGLAWIGSQWSDHQHRRMR